MIIIIKKPLIQNYEEFEVRTKRLTIACRIFSSQVDRREHRRRRDAGGPVQNDNSHVQTGGHSDEHGHDELFAEPVAAGLRLLSADR